MTPRKPEEWLDIVQHYNDLDVARKVLIELDQRPHREQIETVLALLTAVRLDQLGKVPS